MVMQCDDDPTPPPDNHTQAAIDFINRHFGERVSYFMREELELLLLKSYLEGKKDGMSEALSKVKTNI